MEGVPCARDEIVAVMSLLGSIINAEVQDVDTKRRILREIGALTLLPGGPDTIDAASLVIDPDAEQAT